MLASNPASTSHPIATSLVLTAASYQPIPIPSLIASLHPITLSMLAVQALQPYCLL